MEVFLLSVSVNQDSGIRTGTENVRTQHSLSSPVDLGGHHVTGPPDEDRHTAVRGSTEEEEMMKGGEPADLRNR